MIVFLCGPDDFRRLQKRNFVLKQFFAKHPRGIASFFGEEESRESLSAFLRQESLFEEKKLGVIYDADLTPELSKLWKEIAMSKNTTFVVEAKKIPAKSSPFSKIEVTREEFPLLSGKEWKDFVSKQAREIGAKLSPEALNFMSSAFEGDSWGAVTELQKLSSLDREISLADLVSWGIGAAPEYWPLLNGLKSHAVKERLRALAILSSENEPAAKTFNILASSWSEKTPQFAEFDVSIKRGALEYDEALLQAVLA